MSPDHVGDSVCVLGQTPFFNLFVKIQLTKPVCRVTCGSGHRNLGSDHFVHAECLWHTPGKSLVSGQLIHSLGERLAHTPGRGHAVPALSDCLVEGA